MKRALVTVGGLLAGMVSVAGCGGGSGGCPDFAACGGDVVGTWTIESACAKGTFTSSDDSCKGLTVEVDITTASGSWTFNADKSYTTDGKLGGQMVMHVPGSCLSQGGMKATCQDLAGSLMDSLGMEDFEKPSCSAEGQGCVCTALVKSQSSKETGTYSTSGNSITTKPTGGEADTSDYCVSGNTLKLKPPASMMGMDMETVEGAIVLRK